MLAAAVCSATLSAACADVNVVFEQLADARRIAADLQVEFTRATDAANRAVMADTGERSATAAREAEQAFAAVQKDQDALAPLLDRLGYAEETRILQQFTRRFTEYRALEQNILGLAGEGTNLKAQRLSFGPALEAVDSFRDALDGVVPAEATDTWRVRAIAASALAAVREIQVLHAPHIAETSDEAMTRFETRMSTSESAARAALKDLRAAAAPRSRPRIDAASAALDRFMTVHAEILALSRRNTNVRSLAMSLEQKRALVAPCEESLRALRDALAKRRHVGGRWP